MSAKRIVIVGAGFGGIRAALALRKKNIPNSHIVLIDDTPHFEYHPALYRVVTGGSPLEVCIPLDDIFEGKDIERIEDRVRSIDTFHNILLGSKGKKYSFDFLIVAVGSETAYFNIPGLAELSYGFKSLQEALRLRQHLHETFEKCLTGTAMAKICSAHIIIVGGGASGVELAGELGIYLQSLAKIHDLDPTFVTIDLIEAASRLLPSMKESISKRVTDRLRHLGVNIYVNRHVLEQEITEVKLENMRLRTETVIWTAGVRANRLAELSHSFELDKKQRVIVDGYLRAKGSEDIFFIGDAASTLYSGLAQTASHDASYVAEAIRKLVLGETLQVYEPKEPAHAIPIGPGWAAVEVGRFHVYGYLGWIVRRIADLRFFFSILPYAKALIVFKNGTELSEICTKCVAIIREYEWGIVRDRKDIMTKKLGAEYVR